MALKLYYSPLSSYSQKVMIAFAEKQATYEPHVVNLGDPAAREAYRKIYPMGKVPCLVLEDGWTIPESTIIIEYLDTSVKTGTKLIPDDVNLARQTRFFDRMSDFYLNDPVVSLFFTGMKPDSEFKTEALNEAKATLDITYTQIDKHLAGKKYMMGDLFTMADCASAPALAYARMLYPFEKYSNIQTYFNRLAERPSVKKVFDEVAPMIAQFMK